MPKKYAYRPASTHQGVSHSHTHSQTHSRTYALTHTRSIARTHLFTQSFTPTHSHTYRSFAPPCGRRGTSTITIRMSTLWFSRRVGGMSGNPLHPTPKRTLVSHRGDAWHMGAVLVTCIRACGLKPWRLWRVSRVSRTHRQHTNSLICSTRCGTQHVLHHS